MVVYADILIILNTAVDYLLLTASAAVLRVKPRLWRMILSAVLGGFSSLYIFAPELGLIADLLYRAAVSAVMCLTAFSYGETKRFLKSVLVLLLVTCGYGGIMTAIYYLIHPYGMAVANSVTYFNISPIVLIGVSIMAYILFTLLSYIFSPSSRLAESCDITVSAEGKRVDIKGILDTGNSLRDVFGSEIIIADKKYITELFGDGLQPAAQKRYRAVPCSTVSGEALLDAFRCDSAVVLSGEKKAELNKPILAISKTPIKDGYGAVVNPQIFT